MSQREPKSPDDRPEAQEQTSTQPPGPQGPSGQPPGPGGLRRWLRPIPLLIALGVIVVVAGVGIGLYAYVAREAKHPSEETAKFLPRQTQVYFSMNLRPGMSQLTKFRDIIERFQESDDFQDRVDEILDDVEDETDLDLREELLPWLGPELAIGVVDFGDFDEDDLEAVAFFGTTDPEAAEDFLLRFLDYLEDEVGIEFDRGRSRGLTTYSYRNPSEPAGVHFTVTEEYVVFATTERLLDRTIDMIEDSRDSLFESEKFREARAAAADPRFSLLYVDVEGILRDLRRSLDDAQLDILDTVRDNLPEVLTVSSSFINMGIKVTASYDTPTDSFGMSEVNALESAKHLPSDTLALLSFIGVREAWEEARDQLDDALAEFDLDLADMLEEFEDEIGLDVDDDIFGWMAGETAFALLPSEFSIGEFGEVEDALIHAVALIEFDDLRSVEDALDNIVEILEDIGVDFDEERIRGEDAVLVDFGDDPDFEDYAPGYIILRDHVLVGSTRESFEQAIDARDGSIDRLTEATAYKRVLKETDGAPDFVLYANVRAIVDMIVDALRSSQRSTYRDEVEPFVDPIQAFFLGVSVEEDRTTWSTILTFE
ncbi:MAG: DUF3352 domain-containing protein [Chloroflexi bacterium]|nr:DUF3352 domain-containing protein [Chloroflexota bacterium]